MRRMVQSIFLTVTLLVFVESAHAGKVDKLYVTDCGWARAADQSLWSPDVNVGVPIDFSDNCYLIHHSDEGYLLWDTGITDRVAALPDGQLVRATRQTWHRGQTLIAALSALGVKPGDVRYVAISHFHPIKPFPTKIFHPERATPRLERPKDRRPPCLLIRHNVTTPDLSAFLDFWKRHTP
jgi:Metallo-beta-lactamase superfamily